MKIKNSNETDTIKKGYKQTEVGVIPNDWDVKNFINILNRKISYGVVQPGIEDNNGVKFIRGGDIFDGKINKNLRTITKDISDRYNKTILNGTELLISLVGNPGQASLVSASHKGYNIARQVGLIDLKNFISRSFIAHYFNSPKNLEYLKGQLIGSAQQVINLDQLNKYPIPIPPTLEEQEKIATALSDTDAYIEKLEAILQKKKFIKQGALQELLTGKTRLAGKNKGVKIDFRGNR